MFCVNCGTPLPDGANFCFMCGCDLRSLYQRTGTETYAAEIDEASSSVSYLECLSDMSSGLVKVGDYVKFGSYPQNNIEAKEPIVWLVLVVNGNEALLLSRYGLDCRPYHNDYVGITWENCDLRKWLNNDFLKAAFSGEEQQRIELSDVVNDNNWQYGTSGGNNTQDRVFCLSLAEAERFFENYDERKCWPTALVKAYLADSINDGYCWWWLRSPGNNQDGASSVDTCGALCLYGDDVDYGINAVRPALWVNLKSSNMESLRNLSQSHGDSAILAPRVGEYITFGSYPQNNGDGKEPIEWLVLEVKGSEALVISRYGLDCIKYHDVYLTTIWEECYLRKWLNNDFMAMTFSKEDTKRIQVSELANDNNQKFGTYGGEVTKDRVFCLSIAEAVQYFKNNDERLCKPTAFAESHGALNYNGYCFWWLRSPGHDLDSAANVGVVITENLGAINMQGSMVDLGNIVVRPALWLKL